MESLSDSDDDDDPSERGIGVSSFAFDDFHPLSRYSRYGNDSLRSNHRGSGLRGSRRKSGKEKTGAAREVKHIKSISLCHVYYVRYTSKGDTIDEGFKRMCLLQNQQETALKC